MTIRELESVEPAISPGCQLSELVPILVAPLIPLESDPATGQAISGAWAMHFSASVCGELVQRNVLILVRQGAPSAHVMLPGATITGPVLQNDTIEGAYVAAATAARTRGCDERPIIVDTTVLAKEEGGWTERWDWRACGRLVQLAVRFSDNPQTGGTQFEISLL